MTDKDVQFYLLAILGVFAVFVLTLIGFFYFGESTWMKIVIPLGIGAVTLLVVSWARRMIK